jgi:hypothetical protein
MKPGRSNGPGVMAKKDAEKSDDSQAGLWDRPSARPRQSRPQPYQLFPSSGPVTFESLPLEQTQVITSGTLVHRKRVLEAGLFDEEIRCSEDHDFGCAFYTAEANRVSASSASCAAMNALTVRDRFQEAFLPVKSTLSVS